MSLQEKRPEIFEPESLKINSSMDFYDVLSVCANFLIQNLQNLDFYFENDNVFLDSRVKKSNGVYVISRKEDGQYNHKQYSSAGFRYNRFYFVLSSFKFDGKETYEENYHLRVFQNCETWNIGRENDNREYDRKLYKKVEQLFNILTNLSQLQKK